MSLRSVSRIEYQCMLMLAVRKLVDRFFFVFILLTAERAEAEAENARLRKENLALITTVLKHARRVFEHVRSGTSNKKK